MSQITKTVPPSPVLPLPPLEYDVQYMNNLIRLLNYYIIQKNNPGIGIYSRLEISDGDADGTNVVIDAQQNNADLTYVRISELPISATGLDSGQVWRDSTTNILHIVP
jgi:hypothetical protein